MDAVGADTHKLPPTVDVLAIDDLPVQLTGFVVDGAPSVVGGQYCDQCLPGYVSVLFFSPLVAERVQESLPHPADNNRMRNINEQLFNLPIFIFGHFQTKNELEIRSKVPFQQIVLGSTPVGLFEDIFRTLTCLLIT